MHATYEFTEQEFAEWQQEHLDQDLADFIFNAVAPWIRDDGGELYLEDGQAILDGGEMNYYLPAWTVPVLEQVIPVHQERLRQLEERMRNAPAALIPMEIEHPFFALVKRTPVPVDEAPTLHHFKAITAWKGEQCDGNR